MEYVCRNTSERGASKGASSFIWLVQVSGEVCGGVVQDLYSDVGHELDYVLSCGSHNTRGS